MNTKLDMEIQQALRQLLARDSQLPCPVVKSISLAFWDNVKQWVHHISQTPVPFTIALAGASGSGKSMVRDAVVGSLRQIAEVSAFTQDNYYRNFAADFPHWPLDEFYHRIDFDDPAHIRFDVLMADLKRLKTLRFGETLHIPKLVYGTPQAKPTSIHNGYAMPVTPFIVTEGIHAFYSAELRSLYDFRIFVDVDESVRRERWLARNMRDNRGTTDNMWNTTVDCLHRHILPTRAQAHLVINNMAPLDQVQAFIQQVIQVLEKASKAAAA